MELCGLRSSSSLWPAAVPGALGPGNYLQGSVYVLRPGSTLSPPRQLWPVSLTLPAWSGLRSEVLGWGGGWRSEGGFFAFRNQGFGLRLACSFQTDLSKQSSAAGWDGLQHWPAPVPPATPWGVAGLWVHGALALENPTQWRSEPDLGTPQHDGRD